MGNMSYFRFRNTLNDLKECLEHFEDKLEDEEKEAQEDLIRICVNIACDFGNCTEDYD